MSILDLQPEKTVVATGIGCWGKADDYFKTHVFHGTHGRALSFATGIKVARPELTVLALMGDGDGVTIGGNHFIHSARRNLDLTAIITNNFNYGMTGGQHSASSPEGSITTTSPYGTPEPGFDICELAIASGATFVVRTTPYHIMQMDKLIAEAIAHKGFSVVEIMSGCPTYFGRYNKKSSIVEILRSFQEKAVSKKKYDSLPEAGKNNYFPIGKLHEIKKPNFHEIYADLQQYAQEKVRKEGGLK